MQSWTTYTIVPSDRLYYDSEELSPTTVTVAAYVVGKLADLCVCVCACVCVCVISDSASRNDETRGRTSGMIFHFNKK